MNRFFQRLSFLALTLALAALGSFGVLHHLPIAYAQEDSLDEVGEQTGLGDEDIRIVVAKLIRSGLSLLGVVLVVLIIYGGFTWMTAQGNPEKVDKAKKILLNAVIGLIIILMSWTITTFIISSLADATGAGGSSSGGSGGSGFGGGNGSSTSFTVSGFSPDGAVSIRNVVLRVTFSSSVEEPTVDGNIVVTNATTGEEVEGTLDVSGSRVTFTPTAVCPEPNSDRFCFDADTTFNVSVSDDIESASGRSLQCSGDSCSSSFTTGSLIDTEDPVAEVTFPDDGEAIPSESTTIVQVSASDDTEVGGADFSVGEEEIGSVDGDGSADIVLETVWETDGLENGERYKVTASVMDIAGNTDSDSVTVLARPATCFNGVLDADLGETDVDCGGDSGSTDYCGACNGSACTLSDECSSGNCTSGVCTEVPEITGVSPSSGAAGTLVTISGVGFGSSEGDGGVYFTGEDGGTSVDAEVQLSCAEGWSDDQIVVLVPDGAVDGPILLVDSNGAEDATDDDQGALIDDFDVNDTEHPALCLLTPSSGDNGDVVVLTGKGFGSSQGESSVVFGSREASTYTGWDGESVSVTVPSSNDGTYDVALTVGGEVSNLLSFTVESPEADAAVISSINPSSGGVGQYVTISGSGFGASVGTVTFRSNESNEEFVASVDFPDACSSDFWSDDEVIVIVPDEVAEGGFEVYVTPTRADASNTADFTVNDEDPTPGICALTPESGDEGDEVVIAGDNFSSSGSVTFSNGVIATASAWDSQEITVTVPSGAVTGDVTVTSGGEMSNAVDFELGSEGAVTAAGRHAAYAWSFSTGEIPETPEVVQTCNEEQVSAVPNERFSEASEVCVNAVVYAEFTALMNEASVVDAITVEKCTAAGNDPCDELTAVSGITAVSSSVSATSVTWEPATVDGYFETSSTYRVTISTTARSLEDVALAQDVSWDFTTDSDAAECVIERVVVTPDESTLVELDETGQIRALPVTGCVVTDSSDYDWSWELDAHSFVTFNETETSSCAGDPDACATVEALAEGEAMVTASAESVSDTATVTVNFADPYITNSWPNCTEACTNALVGASFNTSIAIADITSLNFLLYRCSNELCTTLEQVSVNPECTEQTEQDDVVTGCREFSFGDLSLTAGEFYRVVVDGGIASTSGVSLTRTNYGGDYTWTFRVREDNTVCAVERIGISPSSASFETVGDTEAFSADAYGAADSCSVSGQQLSATDFTWSWVNPIEDNPDNTDDYRVASWYQDGVIDTDVSSIANGCTALCLPEGSDPEQAVCGNGVLEQDAATGAGEDCDDGNINDDDGCSSSCQNEGSSVSCGDGVLDTGEECDDGDLLSGDGCSSLCLYEGASAVNAQCGNDDIAGSPTEGGEECDDGNAMSGDGCSRECVREGSDTAADIGDAMCGDNEITAPYETCDDGGTEDGDGCSSRCIREGRIPNVTTCGAGGLEQDATTGAGEDCDGGEGCTDECTYAGSLIGYATPSFCGDGSAGTGELALCENGASGDGRVDPTQIVQINDEAVYEVSTTTQLAGAQLEVSEASSNLSVSADITLSCSATQDSECSNPETYGVGLANCCVERPTVTLYPGETENACRNTAVYGEFSTEMDLSSFRYTSDANDDGQAETAEYRMYLVWNGTGTCPHGLSDDNSDDVTFAPRTLAKRIWTSIKRLFGAPATAASSEECIVPVTSYSQVPVTTTTTLNEVTTTTTVYKVSMGYSELLEANTSYTLYIEGDDAIDDADVEGVRSALQAGMNGTESVEFTTGDEICTVDDVVVVDANEDSPNLFTTTSEEHTFVASAYSRVNGTAQEIQSIEGIYAWDWSSWASSDSTLFSAVIDESATNSATVTAVGDNGNASIVATAEITADEAGGTTGDEVMGSARVTAFLCENPWPTLESFPWSDDADGAANGAIEGSFGYMNFSTSYCRDYGLSSATTNDETGAVTASTADDLSAVSVIPAYGSLSTDVIKEYLFQIQDGSGDAIGLRIVSNSEYLSPLAWYEAQGFSGSPSETTVDGFAAVEDGRTVYVSAPNIATGAGTRPNIYPNIYVISYNEGASSETVAIFQDMLANMTFAINTEDTRVCSTNAVVACESDFDCEASGGICLSDKLKIQRDLKRQIDVNDIAIVLEEYAQMNDDAVPTLPSGTYVRSIGSSAWSSWTELLAGALDAELPTDPLNRYDECGEVSSTFSGYDASTCVNQTTGAYACPENSYVYHYRSVGSEAYKLYAELEYADLPWYGAVDADTADDYELYAEVSGSSFCTDSAVFGTSSTCGDGIIGDTEDCEIGDTLATACSTGDGTINQICNSTCSGYEDDPTAECVSYACGNGLVEEGEDCDDGDMNGEYGYCGTLCTYESGSYCGDGQISGTEACDCGDTALWDLASSTEAGASDAGEALAAARPYGGSSGSCSGLNGQYGNSPYTTCAWDCSGPAAYCGDNEVDSGEQCDGDTEYIESALCNVLSGSYEGTPCETDDDCGGPYLVGTTEYATCGQYNGYRACEETTICVSGDASKIGYECAINASCGSGGVCSTADYTTYHVRTCANDGASGETCTFGSYSSECVATDTCGDGVVNDNEECDDGNDVATDGCTTECTVNICSDAYLYVGVEECDEGTDNGQGCSSAYGSTCTACSVTCTYEVSSGAFCGDGVANGDEFCDGSDLPYAYYNDTYGINSSCNSGDADISVASGTSSISYTCQRMGVCNGGDENGDYCSFTDQCADGGTCVYPSCEDDCQSACPFTESTSTLLMTSNQPGAAVSSNIDLYTYSSSSTSDIPNAATITVPACRAASSIMADVSFDAVTPPDVYVVFVTDTSGSMDYDFSGDTRSSGNHDGIDRMTVAQEVLNDAIAELFDDLGSTVQIALVDFAGGDGNKFSVDDDYFLNQDYQSDLQEHIDDYSASGGTATQNGLLAATELLDAYATDITNVRKIVILLSDGAPASEESTDTQAYLLLDDYELYSVALTTQSGLISDMKKWSSNTYESPEDTFHPADSLSNNETPNEYNDLNLLDYAYDGSTAEELEDAYDAVIDSITAATATIFSSDGTTTYQTSGSVGDGTNMVFPWPEGFLCDGVNEQEIPLQLTFGGDGQVEISNVRLNYCAP